VRSSSELQQPSLESTIALVEGFSSERAVAIAVGATLLVAGAAFAIKGIRAANGVYGRAMAALYEETGVLG
jgi:hypothetical protein